MDFKLENFHRNIPNEELLEDLRRVSALLTAASKKLTFRSYKEHGRYSGQTIAERFGDWNSALKAARIAEIFERNISEEDLFDNLRAVWIAKGEQPVFRDMAQAPSRYSASTYAVRYGGWRSALAQFLKSVAAEDSTSFSGVIANNSEGSSSTKKTARQPNLRMKYRVMLRDRFMCVKCGRAPATHPGLVLEIDHILAWSKDGITCDENLQTLCFDCNRGKADLEDSL